MYKNAYLNIHVKEEGLEIYPARKIFKYNVIPYHL